MTGRDGSLWSLRQKRRRCLLRRTQSRYRRRRRYSIARLFSVRSSRGFGGRYEAG
nr:MAG TPA: hypothetical protein [Caudoviricetes sp.]